MTLFGRMGGASAWLTTSTLRVSRSIAGTTEIDHIAEVAIG